MKTSQNKDGRLPALALRVVRPLRIFVEWVDPFDERPLCSCDWPYDPRRAAKGYYTREIKRQTEGYRKVFSDILQDRMPKTITRLSWPNTEIRHAP